MVKEREVVNEEEEEKEAEKEREEVATLKQPTLKKAKFLRLMNTMESIMEANMVASIMVASTMEANTVDNITEEIMRMTEKRFLNQLTKNSANQNGVKCSLRTHLRRILNTSPLRVKRTIENTRAEVVVTTAVTTEISMKIKSSLIILTLSTGELKEL